MDETPKETGRWRAETVLILYKGNHIERVSITLAAHLVKHGLAQPATQDGVDAIARYAAAEEEGGE